VCSHSCRFVLSIITTGPLIRRGPPQVNATLLPHSVAIGLDLENRALEPSVSERLNSERRLGGTALVFCQRATFSLALLSRERAGRGCRPHHCPVTASGGAVRKPGLGCPERRRGGSS
jgi:hypothetical protein